METKKPESKKFNLSFTIIIACTAIIILWALTFLLFFSSSEIFRGTFGDMFGAINALFSGLAFAGIIITILLQREELGLQREELSYTRDELKRTADAQEKSEKALNRQAENLKVSAKLSALSALLQFYTDEYLRLKGSNHLDLRTNAKRRKEELASKIDAILNEKEIQ